jgi:heparan-alpha-glucosaminide N-acetyltransferase
MSLVWQDAGLNTTVYMSDKATYTHTHTLVGIEYFYGMLQGLIAGILCNFSKNDGVIPVNKNLWSLSFVLALASMAFLLQCLLYLLVDAKFWWSGSPFCYAGRCVHKCIQRIF